MKHDVCAAIRVRLCSVVFGALLGFISAIGLAFLGTHNALHCWIFVPIACTGGFFNHWIFVSPWNGNLTHNLCAFCFGAVTNAVIVYTVLYFLIERFVPLLRNG